MPHFVAKRPNIKPPILWPLLKNCYAFLEKTGNWKIFLFSCRNLSRAVFLFSQNAVETLYCSMILTGSSCHFLFYLYILRNSFYRSRSKLDTTQAGDALKRPLSKKSKILWIFKQLRILYKSLKQVNWRGEGVLGQYRN